MRKTIIALSFMVVAGTAAAAGNTGASQSKSELVQRVLQLWHVETVGMTMLQSPVAEAVGQARVVLQGRVPPDRQEAVMKEIAGDVKKFFDENSPMVRNNAQKLTTTTVVPILNEKFTEEELRQLIAILESPVKKKFETLVPDMQKALGEKLAADTRTSIEPKLEELRQRIGSRLRTAMAQ